MLILIRTIQQDMLMNQLFCMFNTVDLLLQAMLYELSVSDPYWYLLKVFNRLLFQLMLILPFLLIYHHMGHITFLLSKISYIVIIQMERSLPVALHVEQGLQTALSRE